MEHWSEWKPFPDPRKGEYLCAPFGPGIYQLRRRSTRQLVLFGRSKHVARRMASLLPEPLGQGRRDNEKKRSYVLEHLADMEYRTLACGSDVEANELEQKLKSTGTYLFST